MMLPAIFAVVKFQIPLSWLPPGGFGERIALFFRPFLLPI
jgi:hypothetical protein